MGALLLRAPMCQRKRPACYIPGATHQNLCTRGRFLSLAMQVMLEESENQVSLNDTLECEDTDERTADNLLQKQKEE